jgi:hypothetical protein
MDYNRYKPGKALDPRALGLPLKSSQQYIILGLNLAPIWRIRQGLLGMLIGHCAYKNPS